MVKTNKNLREEIRVLKDTNKYLLERIENLKRMAFKEVINEVPINHLMCIGFEEGTRFLGYKVNQAKEELIGELQSRFNMKTERLTLTMKEFEKLKRGTLL